MRCYIIPALVAVAPVLTAEDVVAVPPPPPSPWSHALRVGLQFTSVQAVHASESTDPTIAGTKDSIAYLGRLEGKLTWKVEPQSVEQELKLLYGRSRTDQADWVESNDEITYDLTHLWRLRGTLHWYNGAGARSIFTGPEPDEDFGDPTLGKVSTGLREIWERAGARPWKFQVGAGLRGQRWFGDSASEEQREEKLGAEWLAKFEQKFSAQFTYHAEYEGFAPFDDLGHTTHLLTAGLTYVFNAWLSMDVDGRAWYETAPEDAAAGDPHYDTFSYRHQVVFGLSWSF